MEAFSKYLSNIIINHLMRNQEFSPPTNIYVALFNGETGLEGNLPTQEVNPTGTGYIRKIVTFNESLDATTNSVEELVWTALANWGTVTHLALVDHISNVNWGIDVNVLMYGELLIPRNVVTNDVFKILSNDISLIVH